MLLLLKLTFNIIMVSDEEHERSLIDIHLKISIKAQYYPEFSHSLFTLTLTDQMVITRRMFP